MRHGRFTNSTAAMQRTQPAGALANREDQALESQYPVMMSRFTGVLVVVRHSVDTESGSVAKSMEVRSPPKMTLPMKAKNMMWKPISTNMGRMRYLDTGVGERAGASVTVRTWPSNHTDCAGLHAAGYACSSCDAQCDEAPHEHLPHVASAPEDHEWS